MKALLALLLLVCSAAWAATPVSYAILTPDKLDVSVIVIADRDLIEGYRADPSKVGKVELYRELLQIDPPVPALGEKVVDDGWQIDTQTASRKWRVISLDANEKAAARAEAQAVLAARLGDLLREGNWESSLIRIDMLQTQILGFMAKAMQAANLHTNLTPAERTRFLEIKSNLVSALALWDAAKSFRQAVITNTGLLDVSAFQWPTNRVIAE